MNDLFWCSNNSRSHLYYPISSQVVPQFADFELSPSVLDRNSVLLNWRKKDHDYLFGPHQFSDGTLRSIALISALSQEPGSLPILTVIDEPELGLHPYAISVIAA